MLDIEQVRKDPDSVDWYSVSIHQTLSEEFIREFQNKVNWDYISAYQTLSEDFIREFQDKVDWNWISKYQTLSEDFIREFLIKVPETCWLYKSKKFKEKYIKKNTNYEIEDGIVIAYKSTKKDGTSVYNRQYKYEVGKEYISNADHNIDKPNSFGLSAWTKEKALEYYKRGKLFKVGIRIEDIACIVQDGNKIRATKIKILKEENATSKTTKETNY